MHKILVLDTSAGTSITNLTPIVKSWVADAGIGQAQLLLFCRHTTAALSLNEDEERLKADMVEHFERQAPATWGYKHDDIHLRDCPADEPKNGHSHLRAISLNPHLIIPVIGGELMLGKWQSILLFDFDGRPGRQVVMQLRGD